MFGLRNFSLKNPAINQPTSHLRAEVLEERITPAASNLGNEFRGNTTQTGAQRIPVVAVQESGNYILCWESESQDGSGFGVFARRYNSSGEAISPEFRINQFTRGNQYAPSISTSNSGNFVVTWMSFGQDGSDWGIYARMYSADGTALGNEFRVNQRTAGYQGHSAVSMNDNGDFMITWTSFGQDGSGYGVIARAYSAEGRATSNEFVVNQHRNSDQAISTISLFDGVAMIVWSSKGQDGSGQGVFGRWLNINGTFRTSEFQINETSVGNQTAPYVAVQNQFSAVVTWTSDKQDGSGLGIYARRIIDAEGIPPSEFRVNTTTAGDQNHPSVAVDENGSFIIVWESKNSLANGFDIFGQRYTPFGDAAGTEFRVNTTTPGDQRIPNIGMNSTGSFIVSWMDESALLDKTAVGKKNREDVNAQRFQGNQTPSTSEEPIYLLTFAPGYKPELNLRNFVQDDDPKESLRFLFPSSNRFDIFAEGAPYIDEEGILHIPLSDQYPPSDIPSIPVILSFYVVDAEDVGLRLDLNVVFVFRANG